MKSFIQHISAEKLNRRCQEDADRIQHNNAYILKRASASINNKMDCSKYQDHSETVHRADRSVKKAPVDQAVGFHGVEYDLHTPTDK